MTTVAPGLIAAPPPVSAFQLHVDRVRSAVAAYGDHPDDAAIWGSLGEARRDLAAAVAALPGNQKSGPALECVRGVLKSVAESGAWDRPVDPEDRRQATELQRRGWPGLLGAMLLVPAWQWAEAPRLEAVPAWLWADYTMYLFYSPQGFTAVGQAADFGVHALRRLEELARLVTTNRGSAAVRAAAATYQRIANCIPLYFTNEPLRRHFELRGKIFAAAVDLAVARPAPLRPRAGRRLRVGFVNRHFGPQTETYTTLPLFEQLDPERFEVLLFVHRRTDAVVEKFAAGRVTELRELPAALPAQVADLRAADLDVVVFGTNVTAVCNEVTLLALHRVAPLQVVNNSSCTTSGFPEIDLYVSGTETEVPGAAAHFTERLGLVPGPTHAFNYEADRVEPTTRWTRASLGLPEDAVVFVSAANYYKVIPEMREVWAKLLAAVPGSRLLLHPFNPNWSSSYPIRRFQAEFAQVLERHGVAASRLVLSSHRLPSRNDVKELLAVGDVYLDTFPFGGVNSLIDPLERGLPVVAWEGEAMRSRMGAALLRELRLPELIATDEARYLEIAAGVAQDPGRRDALRDRIRGAMEATPLFLDSLAASDQFGALLETAFDELAAVGPAAFRAAESPLLCPHRVPTDSASRLLHGRLLLSQGRADRGTDYLLAALNGAPDNPEIWFELAHGLRQRGQMPQAIQSLETSLKLKPMNRPAWALLVELAEQVGAADLAAEARSVMEQIPAST